jgi:hypothetical protein
MWLLQESWTKEQEDKLQSKNGLDEIELHDVAMQVEQACLKRMASLEGQKDVGRTKSTVVGLGLRHLSWERRANKNLLPRHHRKLSSFFLHGC